MEASMRFHPTMETLLGRGVKNNTTAPLTVNYFHQVGAILPAILLALLFTVSANAATFTVNTLADNENNGCGVGNCTLREAINAANGTGAADTIDLTGLTGIIELGAPGSLDITSDITINGPGARLLAVDANNIDRVFLVRNPNTDAFINGITITGGNAQPVLIGLTLLGDGGGILNTNGANLTLNEVAVTGNHSVLTGGGVATRAILLVVTNTTIINSLINNNTSTLTGAGLSNLGTGIVSSSVLNVANTTVTDNVTLAEGGGLSNIGGIVNLNDNTISHNTSVVAGGGIVNVLGILIGQVNMRNNILARNNAVLNTNLISSDGLGLVNSRGGNLVGNNLDIQVSFAASVFVGINPQPNVNADIVGSISTTQIIDPLLGALQNNGGPTNTRAIPMNSPAVNIGMNCVFTATCSLNPPPNGGLLPTDQRSTGFTRMSGGSVDSGAYEFQFTPTAAMVGLGGKVTDANGLPVRNAYIAVYGPQGMINTAVTSPFGYYYIPEVEVGFTYVVSAVKKGYEFQPQVIVLQDHNLEVNFPGILLRDSEPVKGLREVEPATPVKGKR